MLIRPTTDEDVAALSALVTAVARERLYLGSTEGFTLEQTRAYLRHLRESGGIALVAMEHDRLVGWIDVSRGPFEGLTHYGRLGMGLAVDARGQGLGRLLLDASTRGGFRIGTRAQSNSRSSPPTPAPSRSTGGRGFVEEGCRRCARKLDGVCDDILMFGLLREEWRDAHRP